MQVKNIQPYGILVESMCNNSCDQGVGRSKAVRIESQYGLKSFADPGPQGRAFHLQAFQQIQICFVERILQRQGAVACHPIVPSILS